MSGECTEVAAWRHLSGGAELRLLEVDDAQELHALIEANREHLAIWMPLAAAQTFDDTVAFLDRVRRQAQANDGFQLAVTRGDWIVGVVGFHGVDWDNRSTAIGYWLAASEQGKRTMTEAVRALIDHAFSTWRLNRVEIRAGPSESAIDTSTSPSTRCSPTGRNAFPIHAMGNALRPSRSAVQRSVPSASSMKGPSSSPAWAAVPSGESPGTVM